MARPPLLQSEWFMLGFKAHRVASKRVRVTVCGVKFKGDDITRGYAMQAEIDKGCKKCKKTCKINKSTKSE